MKAKKVISAICAVIMSAMMFAGCGGSDSSSIKDTEKNSSESTVSEETSDESKADESEANEESAEDTSEETSEEIPEEIEGYDTENIKYYNSDFWGETGLLYEIPEALWENDMANISTAFSKMCGGTVGSVRPVDVFHTYNGSKTGAEGVPDVWYVSYGYTQAGYEKSDNNEGVFSTAYPFIKETAKCVYAAMKGIDYETMPEDEIEIDIREFESDEIPYNDVPPYAMDRTKEYTWLKKNIHITVVDSEREYNFFLRGGFVRADMVKNEKTTDAPMFVFAVSKDEESEEYLDAIITHAFETLRHT